jgi:predicted O-methyltransferase YrrM
MTQERWSAVDAYLGALFTPPDPVLEAALAATEEAGMPAINVSPPQGKLLQILASALQARAILEIGTLGGYSTIWLARALPPGGRLVTLELSERHAEVARANLARAGLAATVEVRVGPALATLPALAAEGPPPFDLVFIDADKVNTPAYFRWARSLTRRGGLIITDNVVRGGAVVDEANADPNVQGVRGLNELMAADQGVTATAIQTVGGKGYDGLAIALVAGDPLPPPGAYSEAQSV